MQLDLMKAAAIALVILDHTVSHYVRSTIFPYFWELTSVPLFLIIMGFNTGNSLRSMTQKPMREVYSREYIRRKTNRYLLPVAYLFAVGMIIAAVAALLQTRFTLSLGNLPFLGPGVWFVPIVLSAVLVLPGLYRVFLWKPRLTIAVCFTTDLAQYLVMYLMFPEWPTNTWPEDAFRIALFCSVTIYLFPVTLGFWLSEGHGITLRHNYAIHSLLLVSLMYIIAYQFFGYRVFFIPEEGAEFNPLVMPYSVFLFLLGMRVLPTTSGRMVTSALAKMGKASYHILMTQILYFAIMYNLLPALFPLGPTGNSLLCLSLFLVNLVTCSLLGTLWYWWESSRQSRRVRLSTLGMTENGASRSQIQSS